MCVLKYIFKNFLLIIPSKCLVFCCTRLTLSVKFSVNLLKLLIFIKKCLYYYQYSKHNRPVSLNFDLFSKISRPCFNFRGNVVTSAVIVDNTSVLNFRICHVPRRIIMYYRHRLGLEKNLGKSLEIENHLLKREV